MKRNSELEAKLVDANKRILVSQMKSEREEYDIPIPDPSKCCPICGGQCFETIRKSNGILGPGGRSWPIYYICAGCSVMFADPARFLREQEKTNAHRS
jgi:hypothetical protein